MISFRHYGFSIGALHVTWRDLWTELGPDPKISRGLEIAWHNAHKPGLGRVLVHRGFKDAA